MQPLDLDPRIAIHIPENSKLGHLFLVPPLLFVADTMITSGRVPVADDWDPDFTRRELARQKLSGKILHKQLGTAAHSIATGSSAAAYSQTTSNDKFRIDIAAHKAETYAVVIEEIYRCAPHLFKRTTDKIFIKLLEDKNQRSELLKNIGMLAAVDRRLTIPARRSIPGTERLKSFEWREWLFEGIRHERFRSLIKLSSKTGLFVQTQTLIHDKLWNTFYFQRFLSTWLPKDEFRARVRALETIEPLNYISKFWAELYCPTFDAGGIFLRSSGGLFRRLYYLIYPALHTRILKKTRHEVSRVVKRHRQGETPLSKIRTVDIEAKRFAELDILKLRAHPGLAKILDLSPIEILEVNELNEETRCFVDAEEASVEASETATKVQDLDEDDKFDTEIGIVPGSSDQDTTMQEPEKEEDFDDLVTLVESVPPQVKIAQFETAEFATQPPEPVIEIKENPTAVQVENPHCRLDPAKIPGLGDDIEHITLNDLSQCPVGSFIQLHLNYKNFYYTIEKLDKNNIQMWLNGSGYAIRGSSDQIIETQNDGLLSLGDTLTLLQDEPDPEMVASRWPKTDKSPFYTMIRRFSPDDIIQANGQPPAATLPNKQPRLFFLSRLLCRFLIDDPNLILKIDEKTWKFDNVKYGTPVLLGRLPKNDIHLRGVGGISRRHSAVVREQDNWYLVDLGHKNLGSTNGTYYFGHRLKPGAENKENWIPLPTGARSTDLKLTD